MGKIAGIYSVIAMISTALASQALADRVNNGGVGVICYNAAGEISSVETLDAYEVRLTGEVLDVGEEDFYFFNVKIALDRLQRLSPKRAFGYSSRVLNLAGTDPRHYFSDRPLPPSDDLGVAPPIPANCQIAQLAVRRPDWAPDKEFLFDWGLWAHMASEDKAALMLHEVIYEEAVQSFGHLTSERARKFNHMLLTGDLDDMSLEAYVTFIGREVGFLWTDIDGVDYRILFDSNGRLTSPVFDAAGRFVRGIPLLPTD